MRGCAGLSREPDEPQEIVSAFTLIDELQGARVQNVGPDVTSDDCHRHLPSWKLKVHHEQGPTGGPTAVFEALHIGSLWDDSQFLEGGVINVYCTALVA